MTFNHTHRFTTGGKNQGVILHTNNYAQYCDKLAIIQIMFLILSDTRNSGAIYVFESIN